VEHVVAFNYTSAPDRFKVIAETLGIDCRGLNHRQIRTRLVEHLIASSAPSVSTKPWGCMA
jgi:alcohol dehydrogenase class IV